MSVTTYIALFFGLVFPCISVFILRYLRSRLTALPFYSIGGFLFALSAAAVIWLVQARIETVQIGSLSITQPQGIDMQLPFELPPLDPTPAPVATPAALTATPSSSPTARPTLTATATAAATASATPSPSPSATPVAPTATPVAPTATPEPPPPPPTRRTYTVQPGDTLRSIASDFGVTVQAIINANDLTAAEADSLQPGDTLIIP